MTLGNCCQFGDSPNQPGLPRQLKTHIGFSMFPILGTNLWYYTIALTLSLDQGTINVGTSRLSRFLPMTKNLCLRECVWIHLEQHWWLASSCSRGFLSFRKSPFLFQVLYTVLTLRPRRDLRLTDLNFIFTTKKGDHYIK